MNPNGFGNNEDKINEQQGSSSNNKGKAAPDDDDDDDDDIMKKEATAASTNNKKNNKNNKHYDHDDDDEIHQQEAKDSSSSTADKKKLLHPVHNIDDDDDEEDDTTTNKGSVSNNKNTKSTTANKEMNTNKKAEEEEEEEKVEEGLVVKTPGDDNDKDIGGGNNTTTTTTTHRMARAAAALAAYNAVDDDEDDDDSSGSMDMEDRPGAIHVRGVGRNGMGPTPDEEEGTVIYSMGGGGGSNRHNNNNNGDTSATNQGIVNSNDHHLVVAELAEEHEIVEGTPVPMEDDNNDNNKGNNNNNNNQWNTYILLAILVVVIVGVVAFILGVYLPSSNKENDTNNEATTTTTTETSSTNQQSTGPTMESFPITTPTSPATTSDPIETPTTVQTTPPTTMDNTMKPTTAVVTPPPTSLSPSGDPTPSFPVDPGPSCTLCAVNRDGSTSAFDDFAIRTTNPFNALADNVLSCAFVRAKLEALATDPSIADSSQECKDAQLEAYQLGCCSVPPTEYCEICPDGSPYDPSSIVPIDGSVNDPTCIIYQYRFASLQPVTNTGNCADTILQRTSFYCDCPGTSQQCFLCPGGSTPPNPYKADAYLTMGTCQGWQFIFSAYNEFECEFVRPFLDANIGADLAAFCKCPDYQMPDTLPDGYEGCRFCPDGFFVTHPDKVHTPVDARYQSTCAEAEAFTEYITSSVACDFMQQARDECCSPCRPVLTPPPPPQVSGYCGDDQPCLIETAIPCETFVFEYDFEGTCCSLQPIPETGGCRVEVYGGNCFWTPRCGECDQETTTLDVVNCTFPIEPLYYSGLQEPCPSSDYDPFDSTNKITECCTSSPTTSPTVS